MHTSPGMARTASFMMSESKNLLLKHAQEDGHDTRLDLEKGALSLITKGTAFRKSQEHIFLTPNAEMRDWWLHGLWYEI